MIISSFCSLNMIRDFFFFKKKKALHKKELPLRVQGANMLKLHSVGLYRDFSNPPIQ